MAPSFAACLLAKNLASFEGWLLGWFGVFLSFFPNRQAACQILSDIRPVPRDRILPVHPPSDKYFDSP